MPRTLLIALLALMWVVVEPSLPVAARALVPRVIHRSVFGAQSMDGPAGQHTTKAVPDQGQDLTSLASTSKDEPASVLGKGPPTPPLESSPAQRRRQEVLGLIRYPWEKLGYEIVFLDARPGYRAMTISDRKRIEVYVRPGDDIHLIAFDLAHELGHAYDLEYNDAARRDRWRELRGIDPSVPWFGCNRCPDYHTPAGDFAETFALLLLGPQNYHSRISTVPTDVEIPALADFCGIKAEH